MVTFEDIRNNAEIRTYIEKGNENLGVLGFTKHSIGHAMKVSDMAARILEELNYDARTVELARIAGYMTTSATASTVPTTRTAARSWR